jgi:hypothetical protein
MDSVGFVQHVSGPTHCHSHALDLVLSRGINIVDLNVFPHNPGLSDHYFIMFAVETNNLLRLQPRIIKSWCYKFSDNPKISRCPSRHPPPTQGHQSTKIG